MTSKPGPIAQKIGSGDDFFLRLNGAGEMLVFSAADFEDFLEPRPELAAGMEAELEQVVRHLVSQRWPFRLHATYDESISRMLDVFEKVNREIPFDGLHWFFRSRRDGYAAQYRAHQSLGRRHSHPASHGVSGRIFCRTLRR